MTLTEFRYVVAVAREQHFGRAAAACNVSQPTLSVAVRKLEDELGVRLFERGTNRVAITPVGRQLVQQARRVLGEVDALRALAEQARDPLASPLRVGAIHTIAPYLFPELIPALRDAAPGMPLLIQEDYTEQLVARLNNLELDAIIAALPLDQSGLEIRPVYDEPFRVILPAAHPWAALERIDPARLGEELVLLVGARHCFRDQVISACPEFREPGIHDQVPAEALEGSSLETIRHMVASGMGISVVPCTATQDEQRARSPVLVRRFTEPEPRRRVVLAWRKGFPRLQAVQALRAALRACRFAEVRFIDGPEAA
ncbi:MAG: LysR substrate-binding domain-containing protein [Halofilum sp. (in: g-proteobacteria)]|nr:LysR substrate-binding domain-containing protein [Halofilum sp. (in: g-proteobacteria)]